jgi:hypothetical protein
MIRVLIRSLPDIGTGKALNPVTPALTRAALSTCGRAKSKFLSVYQSAVEGPGVGPGRAA